MRNRIILLTTLAAALAAALIGCSGSGQTTDEKQAFDALAPKPVSDAQKKQMSDLQAKFGKTAQMPGHSNGGK